MSSVNKFLFALVTSVFVSFILYQYMTVGFGIPVQNWGWVLGTYFFFSVACVVNTLGSK